MRSARRHRGLETPGATAGAEYLIDASRCDASRLKQPAHLAAIIDEVVADLGLQRLGGGLWHQFPEPGGVTGLVMLSESHLAVHTFPEWNLATFSFFCCRPHAEWPWEDRLRDALGAQTVLVRIIRRGADPTTDEHSADRTDPLRA